MLTLLLLAQSALAGSQWLYNDGFADNSEVGFQGGFIDGECWASLYTPDSSDYPLTVTAVRALVGGSSDKQLFTVAFYNPSGQSMSGATSLGSTGIAMVGNNESWNEITVSDLELGSITIESGNVAVAICLDGHSGYPAIARDTDGLSFANGSWLYAGGSWNPSQLYGLSGDWIMRICIESDAISGNGCSSGGSNGDGGDGGDGGDTGSDVIGELALETVAPATMIEGEALDVILVGDGFETGAEARIGGIPLVGQEVVNGQTIQGRTPTTLPIGVHDIEVVLDDGTSTVLVGGFEVTSAKGCAHTPARSGLWALLCLPLLVLRRRR